MILVTGGAGFIGANLISVLLSEGEDVRVLDNLSRGDAGFARQAGVEVVAGDIRDTETVQRAIKGVRQVVHLAAFGSVADSVQEPFENFDVNARGTLVVLAESARARVERVVFASTGGALIGNADPPVDETSLPWPISPYGASKLAGEAYCHAFAGSYGLGVVALRFANVYGPFSDRKKGAGTVFIKNALAGQPLTIYGDGSATRDFLYVEDLCLGIASALRAPLADEVLHLASGQETTIDDLARLILELTGRTDVPIQYVDRRPGEVERNFADNSLAAELLEFAPRHSLREGMEKTIEWFRTLRDLTP